MTTATTEIGHAEYAEHDEGIGAHARAALRELRDEHRKVRDLLSHTQVLARRVAEEQEPRGWAQLRRAITELSLVMFDHMAREELQLEGVLRAEGPWGELRLQTLRHEHEEQRQVIGGLAGDVAAADRPAAELADDIRWLVGRLLADMDEEECALLDADAVVRAQREPRPRLTCGDVMQRPVRWLGEDDTATTAARVMRESNVGCLIVCDRSGRPRGIVTDRDLALNALDGPGGPGTPLGEFMSRDVVCCRPTDDLEVAERAMAEHRKSRLVITDPEGRVHGVLSVADLTQTDDPTRAGQLLREIHRREARASTRPPSGTAVASSKREEPT
jgi:CBS domain-containing protein